MSAGIPEDVRRLVIESIDSVRQLDLLLLLRDGGSARSWTTSELNAVLRSAELALEGDLAGLLAAGLVATEAGPPTTWRYEPGPAARTIDQLAACYRTHRTSIIGMVTQQRRSGGALGDFADAFRFRRKDDRDG